MHDIYEPLTLYRDELRDKHAENAAALFDRLSKDSGVDIPANKSTVGEIRTLESDIASETTRRNHWRVLNTLSILAAVITGALLAYALYCSSQGEEAPVPPAGIAGSIATLILGILASVFGCAPRLRAAAERIAELKTKRDALESTAWEQMAPLNALFDWGQPASLIHQTAPRIEFDPYFSEGRLHDLERVFGWDGSFNRSRSVIFSHSGEINGNPFVVAQTLSCRMTQKTYHGSLSISWRESYTDANGRRQTITRYQTLHASVEKPFPTYPEEKVLIYGNDAAPDLTFSRQPSSLASAGDTAFGRWRVRSEIKRLEKFSRNLDDDSNYTIMANREFEALFHATDRSDEVQFRLLFTPLAQQQMVRLLKDREVGYGDDFCFRKDRRVNYVVPEHLQGQNIDTNPDQFHSYDWATARRNFIAFNADFFRGLYFALAPLLSIPLYQQLRTHETIYGTREDRASSFWEHEALANFYGDARFKHPACVTRSLLKTYATPAPDGSRNVQVTAYGYRAEQRTDYVSVWGGDGRMHDVPVNWTEYLPVQQTTPLSLVETDNLTLQDYQSRLADPTKPRPELPCPWDPRTIASIFRRSIVSRL